jgi:alkylglycerol monooxygenase
VDARAIAIAVPLFFLLIGIEAVIARRRRKAFYRFNDAIGSLSCGVGQQALGFFFTVFKIGAYAFVYEHLRVATIPMDSIAGWIAILFGVDLAYYAYHRASHRMNFLWATHIVHHQSEEYNLSTALRQSWFTAVTSWLFYVPLAILGFPPEMFLLMTTLNTLYQFWIHTRVVGKLGFLEAFLNTPSHHRVHHGIDPEYIDKNYAGIFIIWDKLFGTFEPEGREPAYGTVKPLASFNPLWANVEPFIRLGQMSAQTKKLGDKLRVWTKPPEWFPDDLGGPVVVPPVDHDARVKYDTPTSPFVSMYVVLSFALVTGTVTALLWFASSLPMSSIAVVVGLVILSLIVWGGLFEGKRWAPWLESGKLAGVVVAAIWIFDVSGLALAALVLGAIGLGGWLAIGTRRQARRRPGSVATA